MDRSFDVTKLTLSDAADLVATSAQVGYSRSGREKQAMGNMATGALIGGGLGLGAGLLGSMGDEERRKNWLTNALSGGLIGAGVGAAGGMGYDAYKNLQGTRTPEQNAETYLTNQKNDELNARPPINDSTAGWLSRTLGFSPEIPEIDPNTGQAYTPEQKEVFKTKPWLIPGANTTAQNIAEYALRPGDVALSGTIGAGIGGATGAGIDAYRGRITPSMVGNLSTDQVKKFPQNLAGDMKSWQDAYADASRYRRGSVKGPTWSAGPTTIGRSGPYTMPKGSWAQIKNFMRQNQMVPKYTAGTRLGTTFGGLFGLGVAPTLSRALRPTNPQPFSNVPMLDD